MKRNKTNHRVGRNGVPPYVKYGKRPYRYSDKLRQWEREMGARAQKDQERAL